MKDEIDNVMEESERKERERERETEKREREGEKERNNASLFSATFYLSQSSSHFFLIFLIEIVDEYKLKIHNLT